MGIDRRVSGFVATALAFAAAVLAPASAGAVTASPANSFVESIGVNVHLGYTDTPYVSSFATVEQRLGELGVHHVRDMIRPGESAHYQRLRELAARGIESDLILGSPTESEAALSQMLATLKSSELAGAVDAVEGFNEPYVNTEAAKTRVVENQRRIYEGIKGDPALASISVLGPSIIRGEQSKLGDVSSLLDDGNIHSYPEGAGPQEKVGGYVTKAQEFNSKTKPIYATETGYTNATGWKPSRAGENKPISEAGAATYMPRLFFEYWTRHIARTYSYELLDEFADPELKEREDHFGLLRNDLSEKPAFDALHNTIALLADPGAAITPGSLTYTLSSGGATLHSTLLEKRDGSFYLALWRLESVWNPDTGEAIAPTVEPETITLPAGVSSYAVYEPNVAGTPVSSGGASKAVTVGVGAAVTIVKLVPAAVTPPAETPPGETPPGEPEAPPAETPASEVPAPPPVASAPAETTILTPPFMPPVTAPAPACLVPKLKGRRVAAARRAVRAAGCGLGSVTRPTAGAAPDAPPGPPTVLAQRPRAGTGLAAGSKVTLTLSR